METMAGRPVGALEELERGLRIARDQGAAELESYIHTWGVQRAEILGETEAAMSHGRRAIDTAEKSGAPIALVYANYCLGLAHCVAESWEEAASCVERALEIAREDEAAVLEEPLFLGRLAEAYAGLGDGERARDTIERAIVLARERLLSHNEALAQIIRSRVLRRTAGLEAAEEIESALTEAERLVSSIGMGGHRPFIHVERAELARMRGDAAARERELREALRLYTEMGATRRVEQLTRELEAGS
jgi:tetratricopeptide (TPR) repeat protein